MYYTSAPELQPFIYSQYLYFMQYVFHDVKDWKDDFNSFVGNPYPSSNTDYFFKILRENSIEQWKRAVKEMYKLVSDWTDWYKKRKGL